MTILRVGVIGVGRMGERHCRVYSNMRYAHLVGVCDASLTLGNRIAQQYEVPFYAHVDEMLDRVDAVTIATPTPQHYDLVLRCLEHGVHVLVEKPITETVEQAEKLTEAAEASNRVVQVGHIERFNPAYIELKNVLEHLTVLAVNVRRLSPYEGSNTDVDVAADLMIHDTNLVLDLVGEEPVAVSADGLWVHGRGLDHVVSQLAFAHGPLLTMTASRVTEQKVRAIDVTAKEAYLECDLLNKTLRVYRRTSGQYLNQSQLGVKYRQESVLESIYVPIVEPLLAEVQHFVECALTGHVSLVRARDGWSALRLVESIRQACEAKRVVAQQAVIA